MTKKVEPPTAFNGPRGARKCRDILCLLLFLAMWVGMGFVIWFAMRFGNPQTLIHGTDYLGQICGYNNQLDNSALINLESKPYLYYFNPLDVGTTVSVCVASCPTATQVADPINAICKYGVNLNGSSLTLAQKVQTGDCSSVLIHTTSVLNRCFPVVDSTLTSFLSSNNYSSSGTSISSLLNGSDSVVLMLGDILNIWQDIAIALAISILGGIVWVILLRFTAKPLIWILLIISEAALIAFAVWLYMNWNSNISKLDSLYQGQLLSANNLKIAYEVFFAIVAVVAGLMLLMLFALRKRIKIAVEIIREASKAVVALPTLILVPFTIMILSVGMILLYLAGVLYLKSVNFTKLTADATVSSLASVNYIADYFQWYWLFGTLWTLFFLIAVTQTTIAGAVATWYFTREPKSLGHFVVATSFWRCFRYHLGSLAFGSLIIAIVYLFRIIVYYLQKNLAKSKNKLLKFLLVCLQCCLACVAKIISFLNKNAYIEIAIYGSSFCSAGRRAFTTIVKNAVRLAVLDSVSGFVIFFSKLLVSSIGAFFLFYRLKDNNQVQYIWVPIIIVFLVGYYFAGLLLYVYEFGVDTLFLCVCEDQQNNDGSDERPYYMSKNIKKIIDGKHHEKQKVEPKTDDQSAAFE